MNTTDALDAEFQETGTALAVRREAPLAAPQLLDALRPAERVALMAEISNVVKDVIEKQGWFADIKGKKHILIQGWTFIGGLGGCTAKTTHYEEIKGGFKAHAVVVRADTGIEVGSAEQVCMKEEPFGRGKPDYALIGMASTRACSRALATVFRHVVELAGYSATPAEEMIGLEPRREAPATDRDLNPGANSEPRGTRGSAGSRVQTSQPAEAPKPVRVSTDELVALANGVGVNLKPWLIANVAPDLESRERKILTAEESVLAKELLLAIAPVAPSPRPGVCNSCDSPEYVTKRGSFDLCDSCFARNGPHRDPPRPEPEAEPARMSPQQRGLLFRLLDENGLAEKMDRIAWAATQGVTVTSFSEVNAHDGSRLIDALKAMPAATDLAAYAKERL